MKSAARTLSALFLLGAGFLLLPQWSVDAQEIVAPPELSESFDSLTAGLPQGWKNLTTGELVVRTAQEGRKPKEGKGCWRITTTAWSSGQARFQRDGISLKGGKPHALEIWLRGNGLSEPVTVELTGKNGGSPYAIRRFYVNASWRSCELVARPEADDPDVSLSIRFPGTGILYVDSLGIWEGSRPPALELRNPSVAPEADPKSGKEQKGSKSAKGGKDGSGGNASKDTAEAVELVKGNRIYNSSFELGAAGWSAGRNLSVEKGTSPDGERFARVQSGVPSLVSRPFLARPGQSYTISAYVRSSRPSATASLAAVEIQGATRAHQEFPAGPDWKRVSYIAVLPCEEYNRYVLEIRPGSASDSLDVDGVQVEEGPLTDYQPAAPVEVAATLHGGALFPAPNEFVTLPGKIYAAHDIPAETVIGLRLEGFYGETVAVDSAVVPPGSHHGDVSFRVRLPQSGVLRAQLTATVNREVESVDEVVLTVLPEATERSDPFFGISGDPGISTEFLTAKIAKRLGVRSWRVDSLPPAGSGSVFRAIQAPIDELSKLGFQSLGVFRPWSHASSAGEAADWSHVLRAQAEAYRGRFEAFELGAVEERSLEALGRYGRAVAAGRAAIRGAGDEKALFAGGELSGQSEEASLAKALPGVVDMVSIVQPVTPEAVTGANGKEPLLAGQHRIREMLGANSRLPLWNVGADVSSPEYHFFRGADERARADARALARALALSKVNGIQRFYLTGRPLTPRLDLLGRSVGESPELFNADGSGSPLLAVLGAGIRNLGGATPAGQLSTPVLRACVFHGDGESVVAVWAPDALEAAKAVELKLKPQQVDLRDLMGNPRGVRTLPDMASVSVSLWNEVSYLHLKGVEPAAAIALLRDAKPVPPKEKSPKPAPAGAG